MKMFWKIFTESLKIVILTSIISSVGGVSLENINVKLVALLPFLILLPAMNDMIGNFGTILSSKLTTLLYMGKIREKGWWSSHKVGNLFLIIAVVAFLSSIYISLLACVIALLKGFELDALFVLKTLMATVMVTALLIVFMFWLTATAGFYIFKKNEDPDNFLIPITTSVADLGTMIIMSGVIYWMF